MAQGNNGKLLFNYDIKTTEMCQVAKIKPWDRDVFVASLPPELSVSVHLSSFFPGWDYLVVSCVAVWRSEIDCYLFIKSTTFTVHHGHEDDTGTFVLRRDCFLTYLNKITFKVCETVVNGRSIATTWQSGSTSSWNDSGRMLYLTRIKNQMHRHAL